MSAIISRAVTAGLPACVLALSLPAQIYTNWGDLNGYAVVAEPNPGGGVATPAGPDDVGIVHEGTHSEVQANRDDLDVYVNAIGNIRFTNTTPDGQPLGLKRYRYVYAIRLPQVPSTSVPSGGYNAQNCHQMIMLWDGADQLGGAEGRTTEAAVYWQLNPWSGDFGRIYVYSTDNGSLYLHDTGITLAPDTGWHTFEIRGDFATREYYGIVIDQQYRSLTGVPLARVSQPTWGDDLSLVLTAEAGNAFPGGDNGYRSRWTAWFKDVKLFRDN